MTDRAGQLDSSEAGGVADEAVAREGASALAAEGEVRSKSRWRRRVTMAGAAVALIAAAVVLPPLVNMGRYQRQVTALMTRAMGRPVRLSQVELRLLPWPGFVLHDLAVSESPEFGAEPILSARTVVASVAIVPLWRGRLEISRVSVDEASLNLVRNGHGRWNLESLMVGSSAGGLTAGSGNAARRASARFPYLEATESRVNLKNGVEKSPYSLVNTDLSLWQDEPGAWRVRLRGQPVRTDMEMSQGDSGEVRVEASLRAAGQMRDMPLKVQMEWREAQLGQLSRLLTGSDAGWRGEVTADIDVEGSSEAAQTRGRLRATGVRRAEFAPDTPLDFDANCNFLYRHSQNAFHNVDCNTALGNGRLHLAADVPGGSGAPEAMLQVERVPLQAGLDLLRTVRSGFAPGVSVEGEANGSLTYKKLAVGEKAATTGRHPGLKPQTGDSESAHQADLSGSITVEDATLQGGGLKEELKLPKMTWVPTVGPESGGAGTGLGLGLGLGLGTEFTIAAPAPAQPSSPPAHSRRPAANSAPHSSNSSQLDPAGREAANEAGNDSDVARTPAPATSPGFPATPAGITMKLLLSAREYHAHLDGSASIDRLRELAYALGAPHMEVAEELAGGAAEFDLDAAGPWLAPDFVPAVQTRGAGASDEKSEAGAGLADSIEGSLHAEKAKWKPPYLPRPLGLTQAAVQLSGKNVSISSEFSYGPAKNPLQGTAKVNAVMDCAGDNCRPQVELHFGTLDASAAQAALIGPPEEKTLLSPLMDEVAKMRSAGAAQWPDAAVTVEADSLILGAAELRDVTLRMRRDGAETAVESWQAQCLGGSAEGTGRVSWTDGKPRYAFEGSFAEITPALVEKLVSGLTESQWSGGALSGSGKIALAGLNAADLAKSAEGELQFNWLRGTLGAGAAGNPRPVRFERWSGSATVEKGEIRLGENAMQTGRREVSIAGAIPFGKAAEWKIAPGAAGTEKALETKLPAARTDGAAPVAKSPAQD